MAAKKKAKRPAKTKRFRAALKRKQVKRRARVSKQKRTKGGSRRKTTKKK